MSAFSLGGKTKVIFSKIGLFLLVCVIVMAVFGASAKNAGSNGRTSAVKATSTGFVSNIAWVPVLFQS